MSSAYWNQWSHSELVSMQGIELDDEVDTDLNQIEPDTDLSQEEQCCSSGCMDCLGLSWRDFM